VAFYLGVGRLSCQDVANVVWPRSAASAARGNGTIRGAGAAPVGQWSRGQVYGEGTSKGVVGRLGERTPTGRPPGVRHNFGSQSTVGRGRREEDKDD
jgi:hypothetical protein